MARRHIAIMMGPPNGYVSSIHVADGGAAVVAALAAPAGNIQHRRQRAANKASLRRGAFRCRGQGSVAAESRAARRFCSASARRR